MSPSPGMSAVVAAALVVGALAVGSPAESHRTTLGPPAPPPAPAVQQPASGVLPLSVGPATLTVGLDGTAVISGTCPSIDGVVAGPVTIVQAGPSTTATFDTGVTAASWEVAWHAPIVAEPIVLRIWCGTPPRDAEYPTTLEVVVEFVAQEPVATTTMPSSSPSSSTPIRPDALPETR